MKKQFILIMAFCALSAILFADEYDCVIEASSHGSVVAVQTDDNVFTLTALADDGWVFEKWSDENTDNPRVVTLTEDETEFTAIFKDNRFSKYSKALTNPAHGGSVTASQGTCAYEWVVEAVPEDASDYVFTGWSDGKMENPRAITVNPSLMHVSLTANFAHSIYINEDTRSEGGLVLIEFDEVGCRHKLSPIPNDGWTFGGWSDGVEDSVRYIPMGTEVSISANFEKHRCQPIRAVFETPAMGGEVTAARYGSCECDWELTAVPDDVNGYSFIGWSDGYGYPTRYVATDKDVFHYTYTALFAPPTIVTDAVRDIGGMIFMEFDEVGCQQKLSPIPAHGWRFTHWSDGVTDSVRYLPMTENATLTAHFEKHRCVPYRAVIDNPAEGGEVTAAKYGSCECDWELTAIPDVANEYAFVSWSDGYGNPTRYVEINPTRFHQTYWAIFKKPRLEMDTTQSEGGIIAITENESNCEMTLTAIPADGWIFLNWSDNDPDNPRVVPYGETSISAVFAQAPCYFYKPTYENAVLGSVNAEHGTCICDYDLTATAGDNYVFVKWNDGNMENPRTVNIEATLPDNLPDYAYTATFAPKDGTIDAWNADSAFIRTKTRDLGATTAAVATGPYSSTGLTMKRNDAGYWSIPASLNAYAGQPLRISFWDACDQVVCAIDTVVPYISTANANLSDLSVPTNADLQVLGGTLTVDADAEIAALDIYPGAKAVVPSGKELTVSSIYMRGNGISNSYPQLVANGDIINANGDSIYYDYTLDYSLYYPLAVPYDVSCNTIRTRTGKRASYEVQWYDGEERAWNGTGWKVFDDQAVGATLRAGTGYIIYAVPYKWNGTRQKTAVVRFPMHADLSSGEEEKRTTVGVYSFDEMTLPSNKNWNFIGNPYLADYTPSGNSRLMVGYYTPEISTATNFDYIYHENEVRYLTHSDDGFKTYTQARAQDMTMRSFNPYFLQAATAGELEFTLSQRAQNASRRMADAEQLTVDEDLACGVVLTATNALDHTGLLYGEDFTDDYEMNADLVKMFGSNQGLSVYTLAGGEERAFNALSLSNILRPVPLGFRNAPVGEMVFCFDEAHYNASLFDAVMLTDYEAGRVVNLLNEDYRFTTSLTRNDSRFALHAVLAPRNTTDIDYTGGAGIQSAEDGIYDLLGRRVSLDMLPQGVYIIIKNGQCRKEVKR